MLLCHVVYSELAAKICLTTRKTQKTERGVRKTLATNSSQIWARQIIRATTQTLKKRHAFCQRDERWLADQTRESGAPHTIRAPFISVSQKPHA